MVVFDEFTIFQSVATYSIARELATTQLLASKVELSVATIVLLARLQDDFSRDWMVYIFRTSTNYNSCTVVPCQRVPKWPRIIITR